MALWLSDQDEMRERDLSASQPESSGELTEFLKRLEARVTEAVMMRPMQLFVGFKVFEPTPS